MSQGQSETAAAPAHDDKPKFNWTPELIAHLLESMIFENVEEEKAVYLNQTKKSFIQPLIVLTCYFQFCTKAFNGQPPKECTVDEYETQLNAILATIPQDDDEDKENFALAVAGCGCSLFKTLNL